MEFICKFPGVGEIASGKLTKPEESILPIPVELSKKDTLNVWLIEEVFEFFNL